MALVFKTSCATFADLPTLGNVDGDLRRVADTLNAYRWDADSSTWIIYNTVPAVEETDAIVLKGSVQPDVSVPPPSAIDGGDITTGTIATARLDSGTTAGKVVVLNGSAQLPAVSAALLTNINGSNIASGTVPTARLDTGTSAGKLIVLDGSAKLPAVDASNLLNVPAGTPTGVVLYSEFTYDFSVQGGAIGSITLSGTAIPANSVATRAILHRVTNLVGGGSLSISIASQSIDPGGFFTSGASINSNAQNTDYLLLGMAAGSGGLNITSSSSPILTISSSAITAGKFRLLVEYIPFTP